MFCFHGALCEGIHGTACERLTAGQSPGGDNFNVYILRVVMSECRVVGVTSEGLMMIMICPGQMMP